MSDKKPLDLLIASAQMLYRIRDEILRLSGCFTLEQYLHDGLPYLNMATRSSSGVTHLRVSITPHFQTPIILADFIEARNGAECTVRITWNPLDEIWRIEHLNCPSETGIVPDQAFHLENGQPSKDLHTVLGMIWRVDQIAPKPAP